MSFFQTFLDLYPHQSSHQSREHPDTNELWSHLVEIETTVAQRIADYLISQQLGFDPALSENHDHRRREMRAKGVQDANKWIHLEYKELAKTLRDWIRPFETKYRAWKQFHVSGRNNEQQHPEVLQVWDVIAAHETALLECWERECQGEESGLPILQAFLRSDFVKEQS